MSTTSATCPTKTQNIRSVPTLTCSLICPRREDCLALQTGETLELLSDNRLAATPHFVNATADKLGRAALEAIERKKAQDGGWQHVKSGTVTRETLAVFLQVRTGFQTTSSRKEISVADSLIAVVSAE